MNHLDKQRYVGGRVTNATRKGRNENRRAEGTVHDAERCLWNPDSGGRAKGTYVNDVNKSPSSPSPWYLWCHNFRLSAYGWPSLPLSMLTSYLTTLKASLPADFGDRREEPQEWRLRRLFRRRSTSWKPWQIFDLWSNHIISHQSDSSIFSISSRGGPPGG